MPGPKTHDIFYKQLKSRLKSETLTDLPNYDKYNIFAQGHDFLIYHNFYKIWNQELLNKNLENSALLQEFYFRDFVYNFLKKARENGSIEEEQTRLFIGAGYIMHHILDAYTHPLIIYYAGDHMKTSNDKEWKHGVVENLIDMYLMKTLENKDFSNYPVYKDFKINFDVSSKLVETLNDSLYKTYNMENYGEIFAESFKQLELFMKMMKYDPTGLKSDLFDIVEHFAKGASSFSYNRYYEDVYKYINLDHQEVWHNPMNPNMISNYSFMDLYEKALRDGAKIIDKLEKICKSGVINKDEIYELIPNIASTHGLECNQKIKIKSVKKW